MIPLPLSLDGYFYNIWRSQLRHTYLSTRFLTVQPQNVVCPDCIRIPASLSDAMTGMSTMLRERAHEGEDESKKLITGTGKPVLILCPGLMDKDVSRRGQNWLAVWSQNYLAVTQ